MLGRCTHHGGPIPCPETPAPPARTFVVTRLQHLGYDLQAQRIVVHNQHLEPSGERRLGARRSCCRGLLLRTRVLPARAALSCCGSHGLATCAIYLLLLLLLPHCRC
jgi:hypothetical protein